MKIGVIGTGMIAAYFIQSARLIEGLEFSVVYSRRQETGEDFASKNNIEHVVTDIKDLVTDPNLDAIYVASPNSLHYEHAKLALMNHKHVMLEKPFTGNVERAKELIKLSQDNGLILQEMICNIFMPHYERIQKLIPSLGKMKMVQCNFSQYSSRYNALLEGKVENVFDPKMSGGALADINIYNLHFTMGLFGKPKDIHYFANLHENGVDLSGVLILDYGDFKATLTGAKDSFSYNLGQIQGENGYILIPNGIAAIESVVYTTHESKKEIIEQNKPRLYYQVTVFKDMVDNKDYNLRDKYLQHSLDVVEVAVEARRQIGLDYEF